MKEKNYHTVEDFLTEESFRRWAMNEAGYDRTFWNNWMSQNSDKKKLIEEAMFILKGPPFEFKNNPADSEIVQKEWEKLKRRTLNKNQIPTPSPKRLIESTLQIKSWRLRVAASIALVAILGFLIQQYVLNPLIVYQTPFGEQLSIVLPDSTVLELNANSKLTYRKQNPRKIWLDGEAYFQVKKKSETSANFLVLTNDLTVEVLGTAFNVIEKEDKTEVILEEGSVKLNLNRDFEPELYMEPGEMVVFSAKTNEKVEKRVVKSQPLTSWKNGMLEFEDVPLTQVMERIEDIYGWRAVYQNKELQTRNISTPLPSNDLESALIMLSKAIGIEIEKVPKDKILLLY